MEEWLRQWNGIPEGTEPVAIYPAMALSNVEWQRISLSKIVQMEDTGAVILVQAHLTAVNIRSSMFSRRGYNLRLFNLFTLTEP